MSAQDTAHYPANGPSHPPPVYTSDSSLPTHISGSDEQRLEATELRAIRGRDVASDSVVRITLSRASTAADTHDGLRPRLKLQRQIPRWYDSTKVFWRRQISVVVPADTQRDHLALERTFLGYLRTSLALSMTGVIIAQLFRIQHTLHPDLIYGYHVLGTPLAATFIGASMFVTLVGAYRFWRQQNAMVRGKVRAGGWEILATMVGSILLCTALFGLLLGVDIKKEI